MIEQRPVRRARSVEATLSATGVLLGALGYISVLFRLETPTERMTATLAGVAATAVFLRGVHLWAQHRLDPWLAVLVALMAVTMTAPLFVLTERTAVPSPPQSSHPKVVPSAQPGVPTRGTDAPDSVTRSAEATSSAAFELLANMSPEATDYTTESARLNTKLYEIALKACPRSSDDEFSAEATYLIDRKFRRFRATVGVTDTSIFTGTAHFGVVGDGKLLGNSRTASLAKPAEIDVDVTGIIQLRIAVWLEVNARMECNYFVAVWADARLER